MNKFTEIKNNAFESRAFKWLEKNERRVATFFLLTGFVVDSLTLQRVDSLFENLWTIGLLLGASICMVLIHYVEKHDGDEKDPREVRFWLVNLLQFFFGGLLSVFLVFYFRSGDLFVSWPFLLILIVAVLANEVLKNHYVRLTFQISLFFLILFCSAIFLVPVFTHQIGVHMFLFSGVLSLAIVSVFIFIIYKVNPDDFIQSKKILLYSIGGIFVGMNILYFSNLIPPLPLSIKDSGLYYNITKNNSGQYIGEYEKSDLNSYYILYDDFFVHQNSVVYAYSAVFSPTSLNTTVSHTWQHYDDTSNDWVDYSRVQLPLVGGRGGGFRTYSMKTGLTPGKWRVNVENIRGQVIGRIRFNVILTSSPIVTRTKVLE